MKSWLIGAREFVIASRRGAIHCARKKGRDESHPYNEIASSPGSGSGVLAMIRTRVLAGSAI